MPFDLGSVNNAMNATTGQVEANMEADMKGMQGRDVSQGEMLDMQYKLSKWQLMTSLQSNLIKTLSDGIKGTIQNLR